MNTRETIDEILYSTKVAQYDAAAKRLLSKKEILAYILKFTVKEFANSRLKDIAEKYIDGAPVISQIPVDKDKTNSVRLRRKWMLHENAATETDEDGDFNFFSKGRLMRSSSLELAPMIRGGKNEDSSQTEGIVVYDILFQALVPGRQEKIALIINIEAQRKYITDGSLMKRAVYYGSRLISSQKMVDFTGSNYKDIKKVYSIWICMDGPDHKSGINHYRLIEENTVGQCHEREESYNLINLVMVYLGKDRTKDRLLNLLWLLFKDARPVKERQKVLKNDYDVTLGDVEKGELDSMCNLGMGLVEEGWEKGMKQGMEQKEVENIKGLLKNGISEELIAKSLQVSVDYVKKVGRENQLM